MTDDETRKFERLTNARQYDAAVHCLLSIIDGIESRSGGFANQPARETPAGIEFSAEDLANLDRVAAAVTALFSDPEFQLNGSGFQRLVAANRWISVIFYATRWRDSDHILRALASGGATISGRNLLKFAAIYSPQSRFDLPIDALYEADPVMAVALALALVTTRLASDQVAAQRKEVLLSWLPEKLDGLESIDGLPTAILHEAMMNCSYAASPGKHRIKPALNALLRRELQRHGVSHAPPGRLPREKPVMAVVLDWWNLSHAMFRCYSQLMAACKPHFRLVAISTYPVCTDNEAMTMFDDAIVFGAWPYDIIAELRRTLPTISALAPDVIYYPAIGMGLTGLYLSNLRLAPLQIATLGHPATPGSPLIDWVLSPPEFHGGDHVFYERVCLMPAGSVCFVPAAVPQSVSVQAGGTSDRVRVAVTAYLQKLNPAFLVACKAIAQTARSPTEFHFFVGGGKGIAYLAAQRAIRDVLPDAVVHPFRSYRRYTESLAHCDMFLSPFPFGNTNGIVDCVKLGLPGVCLHGEQPHSAIDRGLFRIAGLPEELVTDTPTAYVAAAASLADDAPRRMALARKLKACPMDVLLGAGRADGFAATVLELMGRTLPATQ